MGGTAFPLTPSTANTLLFDSDKLIFFAIDYYTKMIALHCGARLLAAFAAAGVVTSGGPITSAVMKAVPYDPAPYLGVAQYQFPLLAVYRKAVVSEWKERGFERDATGLGVSFSLPPLTAAQAELIVPILGAVWKALRARTTQGHDPNYAPPGGNLGDNPWGPGFGDAEEVGLARASFGNMPGDGNLWFPTLLAEGSFYERDMPPADSGVPFEGVDTTIATLTDDGLLSLATAARVIGTADVTVPALYGVGGTLDGLTLILTVNGTAHTLTLSGSTNAASNAALLAAVGAEWPALLAQSGGTHGWLVLTNGVLGSGSTVVVGSGTANAALGLTPGTTTGADGLAPVAIISTNPAPTVTGVSPNHGTIAGGTSVTVTGTGFNAAWPGPVLFGASTATSVVVVSPTEITCVTPAATGNGTCSVSVVNGDNQVGDLASAFTFTTP